MHEEMIKTVEAMLNSYGIKNNTQYHGIHTQTTYVYGIDEQGNVTRIAKIDYGIKAVVGRIGFTYRSRRIPVPEGACPRSFRWSGTNLTIGKQLKTMAILLGFKTKGFWEDDSNSFQTRRVQNTKIPYTP